MCQVVRHGEVVNTRYYLVRSRVKYIGFGRWVQESIDMTEIQFHKLVDVFDILYGGTLAAGSLSAVGYKK